VIVNSRLVRKHSLFNKGILAHASEEEKLNLSIWRGIVEAITAILWMCLRKTRSSAGMSSAAIRDIQEIGKEIKEII
jgi:hypothetical protein